MEIRQIGRDADIDTLVRFFVDNVDTDYISHQELQGDRAVAPDRWAPDLPKAIRAEIERYLEHGIDTNRLWMFAGSDGGRLVAFAIVSLSPDAPRPFGILEDVVVERGARGDGYGKAMVEWCVEHLRSAGAERVFLESGIGNSAAHEFFEHLGFNPVSVVMMRQL